MMIVGRDEFINPSITPKMLLSNSESLHTPEKYFKNLKDFNFAPNYLTIPFQGHQLQMHYLDEGSNQEEVVLLLHGGQHGHICIDI